MDLSLHLNSIALIIHLNSTDHIKDNIVRGGMHSSKTIMEIFMYVNSNRSLFDTTSLIGMMASNEILFEKTSIILKIYILHQAHLFRASIR